MSTSYLDKGLTKTQLIFQKTLSTIPDQELRKEILQTLKKLEELSYEEYLSFIEVQLSTKTTSTGTVHSMNKNNNNFRKQTYQQQKPLCTLCNSDRPIRHNKENCKAIKCTNSWCGKYFHYASQCRTLQPQNQTQKQQVNTIAPYNNPQTQNYQQQQTYYENKNNNN